MQKAAFCLADTKKSMSCETGWQFTPISGVIVLVAHSIGALPVS